MKYLSNEAIRKEILEALDSQGLTEDDLVSSTSYSKEQVKDILSVGYQFDVDEVCYILNCLDLAMRFEVVPF